MPLRTKPRHVNRSQASKLLARERSEEAPRADRSDFEEAGWCAGTSFQVPSQNWRGLIKKGADCKDRRSASAAQGYASIMRKGLCPISPRALSMVTASATCRCRRRRPQKLRVFCGCSQFCQATVHLLEHSWRLDHAYSVSDLKARMSSVRRSLARLRRKEVSVVWTARSVSWRRSKQP